MYNLKHVLFEERVEFRTEIMLESQFSLKPVKCKRKLLDLAKIKACIYHIGFSSNFCVSNAL